MVDHYKTLEVDKNADEETIRKSYKKLALKYHQIEIKIIRRSDSEIQENF